jgi:hypothetical protein
MGAIAEEFADIVVVTDDNPRTEEPRAIINDILAGMLDAGHARAVEGRAEAVTNAVMQAKTTSFWWRAKATRIIKSSAIADSITPTASPWRVCWGGSMIRLTLSQLAGITHGELHGSDVAIDDVTT